jgi:Cu2+-exporting ATPase/Cu+-exporting ATPase
LEFISSDVSDHQKSFNLNSNSSPKSVEEKSIADATMAITCCKQCGLKLLPLQKEFCCEACSLLFEVLENGKIVQTHQAGVSKYSFLDQPEFKKLYCLNNENSEQKNQMRFFARGMHCTSCIHLIEKLPDFDEGILNSVANFSNSTVVVTLREGGSFARAASLIEEVGYEPIPISALEDPTELMKKENRSFMLKMGIAGAAAMNIMLFIVPIYGGLTGSLAQTFQWISVALFLPILFYSATPFYQGAWNSLKYKSISIDLPIVIAMLSGFVLSVYNIARGTSESYIDSLASFLFLILVSRYLLKKMQQKHLLSNHIQNLFSVEKVEVFCGKLFLDEAEQAEARNWTLIPFSQLKENQWIRVKKGEKIPCDGVLETSVVSVDLSLFNGESLPRVTQRGQNVFAGSRPVDSDVILKVSALGMKTRIGGILQQVELQSVAKSRLVDLTDKASQILIVTVFMVAVIFFAIYCQKDFHEALNRSLALLILACPCAMAFGTPLALGVAVKRASQKGIFVKSANVFERILEAKVIISDKTGTLTNGEMALILDSSFENNSESLLIKQIILSLEHGSDHPIAHAFRESWVHVKNFLTVTEFKETPGVGVEGLIEGNKYCLKALREESGVLENSGYTRVALFKNDQLLHSFKFADLLREDSCAVVDQLQKQGFKFYISSGDNQSVVQRVAQDLKIPSAQAFAESSPEQKNQLLQKLNPAIMLGDGGNDSLALSSAHVGIAVKGGVELSLKAADVYFSAQGIQPLEQLMNLSLWAVKTVKRNLWISVVYNFIGGLLSLMGYVNPLVAALAMPISSSLIILSSVSQNKSLEFKTEKK